MQLVGPASSTDRCDSPAGFRLTLAIGAWLLVLAGGFGALWAYGNTAGQSGRPVAGWPGSRLVALDSARPTLVMFAHPRCPCTRASLSQLERLQGRFPGAFAIRIAFFEPAGADESWRSGFLWERARAMEDVRAAPDLEGALALRCGAATSGAVGLYAPGGELLFWGGLTPSRGHEGASVGWDALVAILSGREPSTREVAVFGCSLRGAGAPPGGGEAGDGRGA